MSHKIQVLPEFTVVQHEKNIKVLHALKDYFNCGVVRKNHDDRYCYRVRGFQHLREIIVPFFEQHKLLTTKRVDFEKFRTDNAILIKECDTLISQLPKVASDAGLSVPKSDDSKIRSIRDGINSNDPAVVSKSLSDANKIVIEESSKWSKEKTDQMKSQVGSKGFELLKYLIK